MHYTIKQLKYTINIEIEHVLSHINFRQVSREMLKTEGEGAAFQHLWTDLVKVDELKKKTMFDCYCCINPMVYSPKCMKSTVSLKMSGNKVIPFGS